MPPTDTTRTVHLSDADLNLLATAATERAQRLDARFTWYASSGFDPAPSKEADALRKLADYLLAAKG